MLEQVRLADAEAVGRDELAQARAQHGVESPEAALAIETLGVTLLREARWPEAEAVMRNAMELWQKLRGDRDEHLARAGAALGSILLRAGKPAEAGVVLRRTLAIAQSLELPLADTVAEQLAEAHRLQPRETDREGK